MDTLGKFGIDPVLLAAQVVNFLIIGFIIYRFLLKPMAATLKTRKEKIAQGLKDAEDASRALEAAAMERDRIVAGAHKETAAILDNARAEAERVRERTVELARTEAERVIEEARERARLEKQEAEREVQALSLMLAGRILERVIGSLFSEEEKTRIMERGLQRIRDLG